MKNLLLYLSFIFFLAGCSSLELESVSSSKEETQRILALGLSHEENLIEAKKLKDNHLIEVVTLQLINAKEEKIENDIDKIESERFANLVKVSSNGLNFIGAEVTESISTLLSAESEIQTYSILGLKDSLDGSISHKLKVVVLHVSEDSRGYTSANFCDRWGRCNGEMKEIKAVSVNASNCKSSSCQFKEIVELDLSDEFLTNSLDSGFSLRLYSNKSSNKISISKAYLMGYLSMVK